MDKTYEVVTPEVQDDSKKIIRVSQSVGVNITISQVKQRINDRQQAINQLQAANDADLALLDTISTELNLDITAEEPVSETVVETILGAK